MTKTPREELDELKEGIKALTPEQKDLLLYTTMYVFGKLIVLPENRELLKKSCVDILNKEETETLVNLSNLFKG